MSQINQYLSQYTVARPLLSDIMRIVLPDREFPRYRIRRHDCASVEFGYRDTVAHTRGAQGLGALRRVGGHGASIGYGRARWPRSFLRNPPSIPNFHSLGPDMGSKDRKTVRRCPQGPLQMDNVPLLGTNTPVRIFCLRFISYIHDRSQKSLRPTPSILVKG
jgi:hypothetical protein